MNGYVLAVVFVVAVYGTGTVLLLVELRKQRQPDAKTLQAWTYELMQRDVTSSGRQSEVEPTRLWSGDASDDERAAALVQFLRGDQ